MRSAEPCSGESAAANGRQAAIVEALAKDTNSPGAEFRDGPPNSATSINELAKAYLEDRRFNVSAFDSLVFSLKPIMAHLGACAAERSARQS